MMAWIRPMSALPLTPSAAREAGLPIAAERHPSFLTPDT